jgi:hypothetical protein
MDEKLSQAVDPSEVSEETMDKTADSLKNIVYSGSTLSLEAVEGNLVRFSNPSDPDTRVLIIPTGRFRQLGEPKEIRVEVSVG